MSQEPSIDSFVKDPSLLVELINEVVDRLSNGQDESSMADMEAQLREVAKAIDNLDKVGVSVPDALRAEKTRIVAKLSKHTELKETLSKFTDDLDQLVNNLKTTLKKQGETNKKSLVLLEAFDWLILI